MKRRRTRTVTVTTGIPLWVPPLVVGVITLLTFLVSVKAGFVNWDDQINVTENRYLKPLTLAGLAHFWTSSYSNLYVPLVYTTYTLDILVGGGRPWAFHLTNLLLHTASAVVAAFLLLELWRVQVKENPRGLPLRAGVIAALAALVFAIHPLQAEPVGWVTGRKDVLSGFLAVLATWLYFRGGECVSERRGTHLAAGACFALSLLAKPAVVALPLGLLILDTVGLQRGLKQSILRLWPWFAMAGAWALVTQRVQIVPEWFVASIPLWKRPLIVADTLLFYVQKTILPLGLAADYGRSPATVGDAPWEWIKVPVVACGVAVCLWRRTLATAGLLFFACLLLPVLGIVPFLYQHISTVADRYAYLPLLGAAIAVHAALTTLASSRPALVRPVLAVVSVLVLLMAAMAGLQVRTWYDSISLWRNSLAHCPGAGEAHYDFGRACLEMGDGETAMQEFKRATVLRPKLGEAWDSLGNELLKRGRIDEAIADIERAIEEHNRAHINDRRMCTARNNLAVGYMRAGRFADATAQLQAVLDLRPDPDVAAGVYTNQGLILAQQGKVVEAGRLFEAALELDPKNEQAHRHLERIRAGQEK